MENPKGDAKDGKTLPRQKSGKLAPSGPLYEFDYYDDVLGDDDDDGMSVDEDELEADEHLSPLTIIYEREQTQKELLDLVQHLVNEHPELIPSAKELLEALQTDENKHAQKAMELLKNPHVRQGFVEIFAEGYAVLRCVDMLAENALEGRTVANRVARIRRDPLLFKCVSGKEDVDIMGGALRILVGYWIDRRLERWLSERAFNLSTPPQIRSNTLVRPRIRATNKMSQMELASLWDCLIYIYAFCVV
ncbi:auxin-induced protein 13 [Striga asiatica]|uniref:Auxin-induced protein 13 n=1 Tax=Striga asiatica TaxID=4170 RepID=A0A5A7RDP1_STRAF|nr:auxin-induced protein 13 [Striga asiatica]